MTDLGRLFEGVQKCGAETPGKPVIWAHFAVLCFDFGV